MKAINVRNTYGAQHAVFRDLINDWRREDSRNGPVLVYPGVLAIEYERPLEMVNACEHRHANPFFHMAEAYWMLAGRSDVALPARFVKRMKDYSDDGLVFHAPYGQRLLSPFDATGQSSLGRVIDLLRADRRTRRAYAPIWARDVDTDEMMRNGKDVPCNVGITFNIRALPNDVERLHAVVFNRSNDAVWGGVCGANVVQFPWFMRYVSNYVGVPVGTLTVVSVNLHAYEENPQTKRLRQKTPDYYSDFYHGEGSNGFLETGSDLHNDAGVMCAYLEEGTTPPLDALYGAFEREIAVPFFNAYFAPRPLGVEMLKNHSTPSNDWIVAGKRWLKRRIPPANAGEAVGLVA